MKKYAVSIVWTRQLDGRIETLLKAMQTTAYSKEEALGILIKACDHETVNFLLACQCVQEICEENLNLNG